MSGASDPVQTRDHGWIQERLSDYLDGALPLAERDRVEQHLQGCRRCAQDLADLKQTVALLRALPVRSAPRAFTLRATPTAQPAGRHPLLPLLRFGTGFAGLLLVLMIFMDVWAALDSFGSLALGGLRSAPPGAVVPPAAPGAEADLTVAPASTPPEAVAPPFPAAPSATAPAEQANEASRNEAMTARGGEAADASIAPPSPMQKAVPSVPAHEEAASDGQFSFSSPAPAPPAQPGAPADSEGPPDAVPAPVLPAASAPDELGSTLLTTQALTSTVSALSDTERPVTGTLSLATAGAAASPVPSAPPSLQATPLAGRTVGAPAAQAPPTARPTLSGQERRALPASERTAVWRLIQLVLSVLFLSCLIGWLALDRPVTRRGR